MENKKLKKTSEVIEFKLVDLEKKGFSEKNYEDYGLKSSDIKEGGCKIGFNLRIDDKKGIIILAILAEFFSHINKQECKLFSIETVHKFKLKKIGEIVKKNKNNIFNIPDAFVNHLLGIAIGGTRGMLAASITVPEYKKIFLPLVVTSNLLDSYKRTMSDKTVNDKKK